MFFFDGAVILGYFGGTKVVLAFFTGLLDLAAVGFLAVTWVADFFTVVYLESAFFFWAAFGGEELADL